MSDHLLRYVPAAPFWQPSPEDAERAAALLRSVLPEADAITASFEERIVLYDPGANWSGVACHACGADAEPWFAEAVEAVLAAGSDSLDVAAPCCGTRLSLNDLRFDWPAGFGRFALEARNPNVRDTTAEQDGRVAACLGAPVRKIWARM